MTWTQEDERKFQLTLERRQHCRNTLRKCVMNVHPDGPEHQLSLAESVDELIKRGSTIRAVLELFDPNHPNYPGDAL